MNPTLRRDVLWVCATLLALLAWDFTGLDQALIHRYGDASGFAWREHWLTRDVLHQGGRGLGWVVFAALVLNIFRPLAFARDLSRSERVWWLATTVLCLLTIPTIKHFSLTSCPWSLAEFGGTARFVSHWRLGVPDGGGGGCFPSGHASAAFSFISGWFALRQARPPAARWWLAATLVAGLVFGWAQMMRGAHFASHTLWTAWLCLAVTTLAYHVAARWRSLPAAQAPSGKPT